MYFLFVFIKRKKSEFIPSSAMKWPKSVIFTIIGCGESGKAILQVSIAVFSGAVEIFFGQNGKNWPVRLIPTFYSFKANESECTYENFRGLLQCLTRAPTVAACVAQCNNVDQGIMSMPLDAPIKACPHWQQSFRFWQQFVAENGNKVASVDRPLGVDV